MNCQKTHMISRAIWTGYQLQLTWLITRVQTGNQWHTSHRSSTHMCALREHNFFFEVQVKHVFDDVGKGWDKLIIPFCTGMVLRIRFNWRFHWKCLIIKLNGIMFVFGWITIIQSYEWCFDRIKWKISGCRIIILSWVLKVVTTTRIQYPICIDLL